MPVHPETLQQLNDPRIYIDLDALERIARKYELDLIVLHGSRAQGYALHDSDIDIAVRIAPPGQLKPNPLRESRWLSGLMVEIDQAVKTPVDCDVKVMNDASTVFLANVARDGIPLFEGESLTFQRFVQSAMTQFESEAPVRWRIAESQRVRLYGKSAKSNRPGKASVSS